jgi:hypothetical protein
MKRGETPRQILTSGRIKPLKRGHMSCGTMCGNRGHPVDEPEPKRRLSKENAFDGVPTEAGRESGRDKLESGETGCFLDLRVDKGARLTGSLIARGDIDVERHR